jgi:hypothetical protein
MAYILAVLPKINYVQSCARFSLNNRRVSQPFKRALADPMLTCCLGQRQLAPQRGHHDVDLLVHRAVTASSVSPSRPQREKPKPRVCCPTLGPGSAARQRPHS